MKKILLVLVTFVLILNLGACKLNNNTIDTSGEVSDTSENKMDSENENNISAEPEETEQKSKAINFGEQISLDFVEITIDGASSGEEIKPDNPDRVYRYSSDQEGEKYVYLYGTIKNISGNKYEFADNMYAKMTFDDKYNYNANITADEGGTFSYIYAYLDPLKSERFYITASIPDELAEQYKKVEVKFGFAENFDGEYNIQENECDYLYSVTVTK